MKIRVWHLLVFPLALLVFAVARAPAAYFVRQHPGHFSYASAEGTVWDAELTSVQLGPYAAANATWRLALFDVLQGKAIVPIVFRNGSIEGEVTLLGNVQGDRRIIAPALRLDGLALANGLRAPGETRISQLDILFLGGACESARGEAETDVLVRLGQALGWEGPRLAGQAACAGQDAQLTLAGSNAAGERVSLEIVLEGDGDGVWRATVMTQAPVTMAALAGAGFTPGSDGSLTYGENIRWLP